MKLPAGFSLGRYSSLAAAKRSTAWCWEGLGNASEGHSPGDLQLEELDAHSDKWQFAPTGKREENYAEFMVVH